VTQEADVFGTKISIFGVRVRMTTYNVISGTSLNFIQEYVNIYVCKDKGKVTLGQATKRQSGGSGTALLLP
jgi:hypothetical protein